ncbi:MAG TPA: ATP-binding protein, partial [Thermoanaerobaculia bacterium]|nr:ATP-binding protein [Thermoanaerobaculia bacterium]
LLLVVTLTWLVVATAAQLGRASAAREAAEARLMDEAALLDNLLAHAPIGFAFFDGEHRYIRINQFLAERINGIPVETHLGRTVREVLPANAPTMDPVLDHVFTTGGVVGELEVEGETPGFPGVRRNWLAGFYPVRAADGAVATVGVFVVEITERKRLEQQRLELLASERAARTEAERAGQVKDEFLATLSHELRTPLNAILGWVTLLRSGRAGVAETDKGLKVIERNARVQAQLIDDLLDISRIVSGKLRLDVQPVDLAAVVEAAVQSTLPAAEAKAIRLHKVIDPRAGPVSGDPARLQQVLWNLLTNALKFTPRGGQVQVRLERVNSHVELNVTDTGQGIQPEFLPYVFERFRQADATTTRRYGGLGLGLSIVRNLVEAHGGTVHASSPGEGRGATFTLRLPLTNVHPSGVESKDGQARIHPRAEPLVPVTPACDEPPLTGLRVLVVEDEPDSRHLIERILTACGAAVTGAASVEEALLQLEEARPNVLISDIGMPGRDGYELMREVRSRGRTAKDLPAVALTAFARSEDRRRALLAGFQVHIAKPVDPSELVALIASLTGRTGAAEPPAD